MSPKIGCKYTDLFLIKKYFLLYFYVFLPNSYTFDTYIAQKTLKKQDLRRH